VQPQTILVDGYNVIRRTPALAAAEQQSLAGGRDALLTALCASYRHSAHRVVVVFDGDGAAETSQALRGCRGNVIFSRHDEPADVVLARLARELSATGQRFTIISDDLAVRAQSGAYGGAVASTAALSQQLNVPNTPHRRLMQRVAFERARQRARDDDEAPPHQRHVPRRPGRRGRRRDA